MQIQYFKSAWGDIKNSPGWFGKMCLLALLNFIPIFGQIVTLAYLYGWAREIAWGTHEPLPKKIFSNDDGKFWRRGWFILVLMFVFALIPQIVMQIGNYMQIAGMTYVTTHSASIDSVGNPVLSLLGNLVFFIGWLGALALAVLAWVGSMRIAIYDRLSAGFQLGKIWSMVRQDTKGILKIFGMQLLVGFIVGIVLSIIISILLFIVIAIGMTGLAGAGYTVESLQHMTDAQAMRLVMQFISSVGIVGFIAMLIIVFLFSLSATFLNMLVFRAMGYWTMQFDVPHWLGQDDPMPFERGVAVGQQPQPMGYQQNMQQPYQPYGAVPPQSQQPYAPVGQQPYAPVEQQQYAPAEQQPYAPVEQQYTQVVPQPGMQPNAYAQPVEQPGVVQNQAGMPQEVPQQVDAIMPQPADVTPTQPVEQSSTEGNVDVAEGEGPADGNA